MGEEEPRIGTKQRTRQDDQKEHLLVQLPNLDIMVSKQEQNKIMKGKTLKRGWEWKTHKIAGVPRGGGIGGRGLATLHAGLDGSRPIEKSRRDQQVAVQRRHNGNEGRYIQPVGEVEVKRLDRREKDEEVDEGETQTRRGPWGGEGRGGERQRERTRGRKSDGEALNSFPRVVPNSPSTSNHRLVQCTTFAHRHTERNLDSMTFFLFFFATRGWVR